MSDFTENYPSLDSYWRAIILFGRNSATYKFALGKALLHLADQGRDFVTLDDLAGPYVDQICQHLERTDRQVTSSSSRFLDACRSYNDGQITRDDLLDRTVQLGFANVIDAFHIVNRDETGVRFFEDQRAARNGIAITNNLLDLREDFQYRNLRHEVEARWRLVETAWSLDIAPGLLTVEYDVADGRLFVAPAAAQRIDVTSSRDALNGYQKGKCFYCFTDISVEPGDALLGDVDHFFPHVLKQWQPDNLNLDGVWNLVLSCQDCNRGPQGKFARVPAVEYRRRLYKRNEYLIESHHPLKETLINQTGNDPMSRRRFLNSIDQFAIDHLIHRWTTLRRGEPAF